MPPSFVKKKTSLDADSDEDNANLYDKNEMKKTKVARSKLNLNQKKGFSLMPLEKIL